jgi:hypothetical protein
MRAPPIGGGEGAVRLEEREEEEREEREPCARRRGAVRLEERGHMPERRGR